jgi:HD-GYP domain-containing protein (c-di-GMP phosphodiesterase class II)
MSKISRKSQLIVFGPPVKPGASAEKETGSIPAKTRLAEAERDVLLQVIPDQVFRIKAKRDGSITVADGRTRIQVASDGAAKAANEPGQGDELMGPIKAVGQELARRGKMIMEGYLRTEEIQTLEILVDCNGRPTYHEVRAAGCAPWELLAVVRDTTARKETEVSIARSREELNRLNDVLEKETSLHDEDEAVLESTFSKLGKLLEDTIGAIQMIVQTKDPPTAHHQARVCKLACAIGREMGLDKSQVDTIGLAALLHDLGKVFIPDETLNKPGKLTAEEFVAIKESAETEFQILKTIDLFYPIADIVHQHHERLNGSGYPLGLKDSDILLEARIISVADVVEAMVSERPYRPALSVDEALREIETGKGTLYDPKAVDACIRLFRQSSFRFDSQVADPAPELAYSGSIDASL